MAPGSNLRKRDIAHATGLIRKICEIAGHKTLIEDTRASFKEIGLLRAIQRHDDDAIYNWLAEAISYQGISDTIAAGYIEQHGTVDAADIRAGLDRPRRCHKLTSYWHFEDCGYRKTAPAAPSVNEVDVRAVTTAPQSISAIRITVISLTEPGDASHGDGIVTASRFWKHGSLFLSTLRIGP